MAFNVAEPEKTFDENNEVLVESMVAELLNLDSTMVVQVTQTIYLGKDSSNFWSEGLILNSRFTKFSATFQFDRVQQNDLCHFDFNYKATWIYEEANGWIKGTTVNGLLDGLVIESVDGGYATYTSFSSGTIQGSAVEVHSDGTYILRTRYLDGLKHGSELELDENIGITRLSEYRLGRKAGNEILLNRNSEAVCNEYDSLPTRYIRLGLDSAICERGDITRNWKELNEDERVSFWTILGNSEIGDTISVVHSRSMQATQVCPCDEP